MTMFPSVSETSAHLLFGETREVSYSTVTTREKLRERLIFEIGLKYSKILNNINRTLHNLYGMSLCRVIC